MACLTPTRIFITTSSNWFRPVLCRCGSNCYNCQNELRGEWVFRVKAETEVRLPFFITLTYDNDHLPVYEPALKEWYFSRKKYIGAIMALHKLKRKWDYSFVRKDHLRDFYKNLQKTFEKKYFRYLPLENYLYQAPNGNKYWRVRPKEGCEDKYLIRRYSTAEYGTFTHRSHYHGLLFFPIKVHRQDVINLIRECWHYGNADVAQDCRDAAVNYVAKHQIKSDEGSTFQRRFAPIFKSVSTYRGGLGSNLKYDESNYTRYLHTDENGDYDQRWFEVVDNKGITYKFQMPRFLSAFFRRRWAEENNHTIGLDDDEIAKLSEKTAEKFFLEFTKFVSCTPDIQHLSEMEQRTEFYRYGKQKSYLQRRSYEVKRYSIKKCKMLRKYGYTLNDLKENGEPF